MAKETKSKIEREFSAGGVVYKKDKNSKVFWLITKSKASKLYPISYWRLPKGWIDDYKTNPGKLAQGKIKATTKQIQDAALREVAEEGGIKAKIIKKIATTRRFYIRNGHQTLKFITYYLMKYTAQLPEGFGYETEKVGWFSLKEAKNKLEYSDERNILQKASSLV